MRKIGTAVEYAIVNVNPFWPDFGRHLDKVIGIRVVYQLLHLLCVNIPFLGVRIYLWCV